jgi:hypothetical protein
MKFISNSDSTGIGGKMTNEFGNSMSRRIAVRGIAGLMAGSVVPVVALPKITAPRKRVEPIPAPKFRGRIEAIPRSKILEYAESVSFDVSYHAADTRRLYHDDGLTLLRGPVAQIAPSAGAMVTPEADIWSGRIVARVTVDGDWPHQYFWKGHNYAWFDTIAGELRAMIIPADPKQPLKESAVTIVHGPDPAQGRGPQGLFQWHADKPCNTCWISCTGGCCTWDH